MATAIALLLVLAAITVLVAAGRAERWAERRRRLRLPLSGEALFAWRLGRQGLALDCLVSEGETAGARPRRPVHVRTAAVQLSGDSCLADVVARWLADGRRVRVEIVRGGRAGCRLRASSDRSVLTLDVADAEDLDRQLGAAAPGGR